MGALERFLQDDDRTFDVASFIADDVREMESAFPPFSVYKYFSCNRVEFFCEPTIRFTQKTSLNDPFELTKRWHEFASAPTRTFFADYLRRKFAQIAANKELVLEMLKESFAKKGIFLAPQQMTEAAHILKTERGRQFFDGIMKNAMNQVEPFVEAAFAAMNVGAEQGIAEMTANLGIFSLSEVADSDPMWGLYASSGSGFVVEFNSDHDFFKAANGNNLLRKVKYTDERIPDFWRNPLYLFLIKKQKWSFEREWRMIKRLSECDSVAVHHGDEVHVCRVLPGMIKSVIFGYNYDQRRLVADGSQLLTFHPKIHIQVAVANSSTGRIELRQLV